MIQIQPTRTRLTGLLAVTLFVLTIFTFLPAVGHDFVMTWDDNRYVVENPHVNSGLSQDNVFWAFTSSHHSNWHPLTWVSHMLDVEFYGLDAAGHHRSNVILHGINALLLFAALLSLLAARAGERLPGHADILACAAVATLFALHPLRVESVAWIAERKDLLAAFFFFAMLLGYGHYARQPTARRFNVFVTLPLALGLMSKASVVTAPLLLIVLDYWPLGRLREDMQSAWDRIREKLPLFALVAAASVITLLVQSHAGTTPDLSHTTPEARIANAFISYGTYLGKLLLPIGLATFYPHPAALHLPHLIWIQAVPGFLSVFACAWAVCFLRRPLPYLTFGVAWYTIALLPLLGLVQAGAQAWADRYSYLTLIGPTVAIVWGLRDVLRFSIERYSLSPRFCWRAGCSLALLVVVAMVFSSHEQLKSWQDDETLWRNARQRTVRNYRASRELGLLRYARGEYEEALHFFRESDRMVPNWTLTERLVGLTLSTLGRHEEALPYLERAVVDFPEGTIHGALGLGALMQEDWPGAEAHLRRALVAMPGDLPVALRLSRALASQGKLSEAAAVMLSAAEQHPEDAPLQRAVADVLDSDGRAAEAATLRRQADAIDRRAMNREPPRLEGR